jgi:HK97 family phage prohead protease
MKERTAVNEDHLAAAQQRKAAAPSRAARPTQRRSAQETDAPARTFTRARPVLREPAGDSAGMEFTGLASATGQPYEMWDWLGPYTEIVSPGAFGKTLAQAELDVPLVLQHVDLRRLARTTIAAGELGHLELAEDESGLVARALMDPADSDVAYIAPKIRSGLVDEMSFKFRITAGMWSPDWTEYHIDEVDIHRGDVAICGYGANPATSASIRGEALASLVARASEFDARAAYARLQQRFAAVPAAPKSRSFVVTDADLR